MKPKRFRALLADKAVSSFVVLHERGPMCELRVVELWTPGVAQISLQHPMWFKPSFDSASYCGMGLVKGEDYCTILRLFPNPYQVKSMMESKAWFDAIMVKAHSFLVDKDYVDVPEKRVGDSLMVKLFDDSRMWVMMKGIQ